MIYDLCKSKNRLYLQSFSNLNKVAVQHTNDEITK